MNRNDDPLVSREVSIRRDQERKRKTAQPEPKTPIGEPRMTKHPYQTCLRMPEILKEDMNTICTKHKINESDLMRRAIAEFVEKVNNTPESNSRYMFV